MLLKSTKTAILTYMLLVNIQTSNRRNCHNYCDDKIFKKRKLTVTVRVDSYFFITSHWFKQLNTETISRELPHRN